MTDSAPNDGETAVDMQLDHTLQAVAGEFVDPYVLQGAASTTVAKVALKHGDSFIVCDARGDLPVSEQETGIFWRGTRFLRVCDLFLEGRPLIALSHSVSDEEGSCQIDLSNPFIPLAGGTALYQGQLHVRRLLEMRGHDLTETLVLTSFDANPLTVTVGLKTGADFRDLFEVRGLKRARRGELLPPRMEREEVVFAYRGRDEVLRETRLTFEPVADRVVNDGVFWSVNLTHDQPVTLRFHVALSEQAATQAALPFLDPSDEAPPSDLPMPLVVTDNVFFNRLLTRGMHDLMMMCTQTADGLLPYGGIPWYVCPFGRDSLITSLEFLPWYPEVARGTLAFLARYQGTKVDPFTEEEPGRILHEFRHGEMANCREIPFIPYYGTIDATPLFIVTLERYIRWTNDLPFLQRLWPHAEAAAQWMLRDGDSDGDTFLEYSKISDRGLVNQGWKDSWDAVSTADGRLADPPIALCEVQGYAFAAYRGMGYLARRLGRPEEAARWDRAAWALQANFLRAFWWEEEDTCYLALDGQKQPCKVVSSNAGQCLWSGIIPDERAVAMTRRMLRPDMYTEWGIRTLSSCAARYNPMSYHNGSVWPHDTALIGAGFAQYDQKGEAGQLLGNLFGVSLYYEGARLPELFCGFERRHGYGPTRYPVACSPQSWAAGAPFLLLGAVLGFEPEAENHRLTLRRPILPEWLDHADITGLRLGDRRAHLRFTRMGAGTSVTLDEQTEIDVHVLPR